MWSRTLTLAVLATVTLAGCSGSSGGDSDDPFGDRDVNVSDTTGVVRGVVIDSAFRPLGGVEVRLRLSEEPERVQVTAADGLFLFDSVPQGAHFITASKAQFLAVQKDVEVEGGVRHPEMVQLILEIDQAARPYSEQYVYDGFMECSMLTPGVGYNPCRHANSIQEGVCEDSSGVVCIGNVTTDKTQVIYPLSREPTFAQSEMVWKSTQTLGQDLALMYSWGVCSGAFLCDHAVDGGSPLTLQANQTDLRPMYENATQLYVRVFADDVDETDTGQCIPENPVVYGCPPGAGVTVSQQFQIYTTIFYGYAPPLDWRFAEANEVPDPPAA